MAATTPRLQTKPDSRPQPGTIPRPLRRTVPVQFVGPWENFVEGAAAALCAVVAMMAVSALALMLLDAGSVGSVWSLTMALTAMAVGGSASAGSDVSGDNGSMGGLASLFGDAMRPSMSGAADVVPLSVTLVGAVVLWIAFSRRLGHGQQRRFAAGELAVRAAGAATAALFTLVIVAALAKGSATMPASAMSGMRGRGGGQASEGFGGSGGLGELMGGGSGGLGGLMGGGSGSQMAVTYHVSTGSAGFGALLWVAVVLGVGCLISRRVRLPLGGALGGLRSGWGQSLSAVVRTVLILAAVPLVTVAVVGSVVGGKAASAAGAALLLAPNAVAVFLTLGVGSSWTAEMHPVQSDSSNPLASLMGVMGGRTGAMGGGQQADRTEHLRSLALGGWPLWLAALMATALILVCCAYRAARATNTAHLVPLHPYRGPLAGHLGMAQRFGVVTAVVMAAAAWLVGASGNFGISMFGSEMGGMRAELSGSVLQTVAFGLLVGGLAGFGGSLLAAVRGVFGAR
ncbi:MULTISPECIES: streptophobe family protein [Streptomyces]|uniref:streptophobe family protein n=1 Tax=Streptomyces TaxID=1883 RepID=UPI00324CA63B|nr:streptophobe family protein [Streptomyces phaeochromogenes]